MGRVHDLTISDREPVQTSVSPRSSRTARPTPVESRASADSPFGGPRAQFPIGDEALLKSLPRFSSDGDRGLNSTSRRGRRGLSPLPRPRAVAAKVEVRVQEPTFLYMALVLEHSL